MNTQKLRSLIALLLLAGSLVLTQATPALAQRFSPVERIVFQCYHAGNYYALGTVLHYVLPYPEPTDLYMQCKLVTSFDGGHINQSAQWVYSSEDPR